MAAPKLIQTFAFFVREGVLSAAREVKPSSWTAAGMGTVTDVSYANEFDEQVHSIPIGGKWVDYDVVCERDRLTFTLTLSELSQDFWKLVRGANPTLVAGASNYVPGSQTVTKGWLQVQARDQNGDLQDTIELFCSLRIETQALGKGYIVARIAGRKLYSTLNSGSFANLTY